MADEPASLLTETQRRRVHDDFAESAPAKRRRDQRKIRSRVAAGMDDFRLLANYPDRQFELAFEEVSDEELARTLADARLTVERVRELHHIDPDEVAELAADRRRELVGEETRSLDALEFRTTEQQRRETEAAVADGMEPTRWKRLADGLLKLGLLFLVPASLLAVVAPELANGPAGGVPGVVGGVALVTGLAIVGFRAVKHDVMPAVRRLRSDPRGLVSDLWNQI
ncbi:ABC transporter permease [Halorussus pelagicus]|uniref:ABC transporter permease n=1 Tax=Halorussus pelagicus TaxID=2505977 RepID=UPI000FFC11D8|nr:ABC transporter permease [Halorussus pelagicus]